MASEIYMLLIVLSIFLSFIFGRSYQLKKEEQKSLRNRLEDSVWRIYELELAVKRLEGRI